MAPTPSKTYNSARAVRRQKREDNIAAAAAAAEAQVAQATEAPPPAAAPVVQKMNTRAALYSLASSDDMLDYMQYTVERADVQDGTEDMADMISSLKMIFGVFPH